MKYKFYFVTRSIDIYKTGLRISNIENFMFIRLTKKTETPSKPEASPIIKI